MPATPFSLVARDLARSLGGRTVLDGVDLTVGPATRMGVVGPNGVGKTTLLRLLAGLDRPDRGSVSLAPPTARVGYLPQEPDRVPDEGVLAFLARRTGVARAEADLERASRAFTADAPDADPSDADQAYADALDRYLGSGAPDFEARAHEVVADLGLPPGLLDAPTASLSGGQAARVSLAGVLLSCFDVFLLDEPTNDLDFAGLDRLERFVADLSGGVVVVSHDRAFLERTVTTVLEIDDHVRTATEYAGGFAAYLDGRAVARRHAEEAYALYETERSRLRDRARRQREWATQGVRRAKRDSHEPDKHVHRFRVARSESLAAKAKATQRALERLERVEKPWHGWDLRIQIAAAPRSGAVVARLEGAVLRRDGFILGPVDLEVTWGERVAVTGPNGAGKTTLLLGLLGRLPLDAGRQWAGPGVVLGEMDQARHRFAGERPLLDAFRAETGLPLSEARSALAKLGIGAEHVLRPAASLSPGERTRAVLAAFAAEGVNCLALDEPTNHLDLPAIEQVEAALDAYAGTLLLVTHDRRLLESVRITRTVAVVGGAVVTRDA